MPECNIRAIFFPIHLWPMSQHVSRDSLQRTLISAIAAEFRHHGHCRNHLIFLQLKCFRNILLTGSWSLLQKAGFTSFDKNADHYGLSLILGGGEASLWELTGVYASLSRVLNNYLHEKKYFAGDYHPLLLVLKNEK